MPMSPENKIRVAAISYDFRISLIDHESGAGDLFYRSHPAHMIEMCLVGQQNFDIPDMEAQRLDMSPDERVGARCAGIDQDISGRCRDEIGGEFFGAYIIEVARNAEGGIVADPAI